MLLEKLWDTQSRTLVLIAAAGIIAATAIADWRTSPYVSLGFFYLFPIMLVAGVLPAWAIVSLSVLCALLSEVFSSLDPQGRVIRLILATLAFAGFGLFLRELVRHRRIAAETGARLRALVETSPAAILMLDQQGRIEMANRAAMELVSPAKGNLTGQSIGSFLPELSNAVCGGALQLRTSMQCTGHRNSGENFVAEVWFSTWNENGNRKLAAIVADVTEDQPATVQPAPPNDAAVGRATLNSRQTAVLQLIVRHGMTNNQIASRLGVSISTVKNILQQLFIKTGVNSRSQMVRVALERYRDLL